MGASALLALLFAGCSIVSGLDEFQVVATGSSGSSRSRSSGGSGDFVTVGGAVSGLVGTGIILQNNGSDDIQIGINRQFTFPAKVQSGGPYDVAIASAPSSSSQVCTVSNGSGTIMGSAITDIAIDCSTSAQAIGGAVVGLSGTWLVLTNAGVDDLLIAMNGNFQFPTKISSGTAFR